MKKYNGIIKFISLLVLLPIIIWELGLKKTVSLYQESLHVSTSSYPDSIIHPVKKSKSFTAMSILANGTILQLFSQNLATENLQTVNYIPEIIDSENGYNLYYGTWVVSGNFINMVKLVSQIEKERLPLRISSVCFESKKNMRTGENKLYMTMSLVNIEK